MNKDTNWSFDANGSPIEIKNSDFLSDPEKMRDFKKLSKTEFLAFYSYVTEEEYDNTVERDEKRGVRVSKNYNYLGITLDKDNFNNKKDWESICNAFELPKETREIYFQPENIVSREEKSEEKVTKEQVEFWLGSDNTLKEAIEVIVYVANGEYPKEQLKSEILDGSVR